MVRHGSAQPLQLTEPPREEAAGSVMEVSMRRSVGVGMILALLFPAIAWALGSDHPGQPVSSDTWPAGLADLVNADNRVHGYFVNWEDVFFFKGDTAAFNDFLKKYSQLPDTSLHVVVHPGRLAVRSPWDKQPRDIAGDWELYASPFTRDEAQAEGVTPGSFVTRIDVWLGGSITLDELRIPGNVSVASGGEIEALVKKHGEAH
jgi:hypothetical protein